MGTGELQIPALPFAPVGMTRERGDTSGSCEWEREKLQIPPLRFAPVGMTRGER